MKTVIMFILTFGVLGLVVLCMFKIGGDASNEKCKLIINSHKYTAEEYVELYNYCVTIRNSFLNNFYHDKVKKWDKVLNKCKIEYEQNYYEPDYNKLCSDLLNLLYKEKYSLEKINFGIIDKTLDK